MINVPGKCYFVFISIIMIFYGCSPVSVPLKGEYSSSAFEITTTRAVDSTWLKLIEIFSSNGLPIKSLDKKNGKILTVKTPINSFYTFENKNGQLENTEAWLVLKKVFNKGKEWKPKDISAKWSIQIIETDEAVTTIKIDPIVICHFPRTNLPA